MTKKYLTIPAVVAGALGMGGIATAAEPTTAELMAQIQQLQAKVQQMEAKQQALSSADVDATVASVLKDAEQRSQLLNMEGFTAGWSDGHFMLASADGNYKLMPMFQFQFRNVTNWAENVKNDGDDSMENGFEITRMKVEFAGNAISKDLTYNFRWNFDSDGGSPTLENAWVQYQFSDNMSFRVGQFKDPVWHEENVSSKYQLAVDRSLLNEVLGGGQTDYIQGVALNWGHSSTLRTTMIFHDGANTDNTTYQDVGGPAALGLVPANWGLSSRTEWAVMGNFDHYNEFTAMGNKEDYLVLAYGSDTTQAGDTSCWFHTIDATWANTTGLSLYGAYVGQYLQQGTPDDDFYNWGFLAQVGYMLNERWEVFGRLDYFQFDNNIAAFAGTNDEFWEITAGVNYYLSGQNAKVTLDVGFLPEGSPITSDSLGVVSGDDDQWYLRGQFQLLL